MKIVDFIGKAEKIIREIAVNKSIVDNADYIDVKEILKEYEELDELDEPEEDDVKCCIAKIEAKIERKEAIQDIAGKELKSLNDELSDYLDSGRVKNFSPDDVKNAVAGLKLIQENLRLLPEQVGEKTAQSVSENDANTLMETITLNVEDATVASFRKEIAKQKMLPTITKLAKFFEMDEKKFISECFSSTEIILDKIKILQEKGSFKEEEQEELADVVSFLSDINEKKKEAQKSFQKEESYTRAATVLLEAYIEEDQAIKGTMVKLFSKVGKTAIKEQQKAIEDFARNIRQ